LREKALSVRKILRQSNAAVLYTTDSPTDELGALKTIMADKTFGVKVLPAFRPDAFINIQKPDFPDWIDKLSVSAKTRILTLDDFARAISDRMDYFHALGCRLADHSLESIGFEPCSYAEAAGIFQKALNRSAPPGAMPENFGPGLCCFFGRAYADRGWVMQYRIGAFRNVNAGMFLKLGSDRGFDAIDDRRFAPALKGLLDSLDQDDMLPKTVLYGLNPNDYETLLTVGGSFSRGIPGKIQLGPAWWFNDNRAGIERQLTACATLGLLGRFIGMTTDSRSVLSFVRHEFFRRVLCSLLGRWAKRGDIPDDMELLGETVRNICYYNAADYFGKP
jgi:glucuronate isomerase